MSIEEAMIGGIVFKGKKKSLRKKTKSRPKLKRKPISPGNMAPVQQNESGNPPETCQQT